jgi:hypothetical protein
MTWLLGLKNRERQHFTGLGALAMANMAGKRPLCAMGPMMLALILWPFLIKEKGRIKKSECTPFA